MRCHRDTAHGEPREAYYARLLAALEEKHGLYPYEPPPDPKSLPEGERLEPQRLYTKFKFSAGRYKRRKRDHS